MYAATFVAGAFFGGIVLALLLRRTVRNELTSKPRRRRRI
jgi:hypothetical protein